MRHRNGLSFTSAAAIDKESSPPFFSFFFPAPPVPAVTAAAGAAACFGSYSAMAMVSSSTRCRCSFNARRVAIRIVLAWICARMPAKASCSSSIRCSWTR